MAQDPLVDARQRAARTLRQGLAVDVTVAVLMTAAAALPGVEWTRRWWLALAALLVKTAATTAASWLHRQLSPPAPQG